MKSLRQLRAEADRTRDAFRKACADAGLADEWGGYRALDAGTAPKTVISAADAARDALHDYYLRRDGPTGVLGPRTP